jgi:hypothetical protein
MIDICEGTIFCSGSLRIQLRFLLACMYPCILVTLLLEPLHYELVSIPSCSFSEFRVSTSCHSDSLVLFRWNLPTYVEVACLFLIATFPNLLVLLAPCHGMPQLLASWGMTLVFLLSVFLPLESQPLVSSSASICLLVLPVPCSGILNP